MQRSKNSRKSSRCCGCPFCASPGRCLDPTIKSGRCGDWVWYWRGRKRCRRRYACPKDPHTLAQMDSRGRLTAASRNYSQSLTQEQRAACIAAGAKVHSRPRLGQSGPLTGHQHWVGAECVRQSAKSKVTKFKTALQVPQPHRVTRSTWDPPQGGSMAVPDQRRRYAGVSPSRIGRGSGISPVSRRARVRASPDLLGIVRGLGSRGRPPSMRRRSWAVRTSHLKFLEPRQRSFAGRRLTPPAQLHIGGNSVPYRPPIPP
jgi:hypothetical protein